MHLFPLLAWVFVALVTPVSSIKLIRSDSLNLCMDSSNFTVSHFDVVYTANNNTLMLDIDINSHISGKVYANISLTAYGYKAFSTKLDPCTQGQGFSGLCPMVAGNINMKTPVDVPKSAASKIPSKFHAYDCPFFFFFFFCIPF